VLGETEATEAGARVEARVVREGRELIRATVSVAGQPIRIIADFCPETMRVVP
jgi:hypothetical protein